MNSGNVIADCFVRDVLKLVVENHHMVGVPADRTADVQQHFWKEEENGADLVADLLGRMKMSGVDGQHEIVLFCIVHVELVAADGAAFHSDSEQLALHGIEQILFGIFDGENLIQRIFQAGAGAAAVNRNVLESVGNPGVHDAGRAKFASEVVADDAAGFRMMDPELADLLFRGREGESLLRHRMCKERRIEIKPDSALFRP